MGQSVATVRPGERKIEGKTQAIVLPHHLATNYNVHAHVHVHVHVHVHAS